MMLRALYQAAIIWLAAIVIAGLAMLGVFIATAHAQARLDNLVSGSASATGTSQTTIIAAPSGTRVNYITAAQCGRSDAGTTAIYVTLNDNALTVIVLPNSGGGNNIVFTSPLTVPAATALTFAASGQHVDRLLQRAGLHRQLTDGRRYGHSNANYLQSEVF
jgi:hypothetical protein